MARVVSEAADRTMKKGNRAVGLAEVGYPCKTITEIFTKNTCLT